jgi:hypothetical protein
MALQMLHQLFRLLVKEISIILKKLLKLVLKLMVRFRAEAAIDGLI